MKAKRTMRSRWFILLGVIIIVIIAGLVFAKVLLSPSNHDYTTAVKEEKEKDYKTGTYYVYGGAHGLPLHVEPSKHSKVIKAIPNKAAVEIITHSYRGFYKIKYRNLEGFVQGRYLLKFNKAPGEKLKERLSSDYPLYYVVNCKKHTNLYIRRNSSSKVLTKVDYGYRVRLLETGRNGYYKVAYKNRVGYISSECLSKFDHKKEAD